MIFNYKIIGSFLGLMLIMNGIFMLFCLPFAFYFDEGDWEALLIPGTITAVVGISVWFFSRDANNQELKKRDGYLIVTAGWVLMSVFGALPYIFSGFIPSYTDAFFETISGYSTTGATILTDIEAVPKGILFWRSLTQWIGGMGIIVLTIAILPILGIGGMQLFIAEAPGITPDKLKPRIQGTAKRLWFVYVGLTLGETVLLMLGGLSFYDAINHALTTMATGGFSTKNASAAHFTPFVQYVMIVFMFIAGVNFTLNYFWLKGKFGKLWENEEFRFYLFFILGLSLSVALALAVISNDPLELAFRNALFQVISVVTTTGYITADYTAWTPFLTILFFLLMFFGGSAGSTAGGVKIVRHIVLLKNSFLELSRQLHPTAVLPVRLNGKTVSESITFNIMAFFIIYIAIFALGSVVVALLGVDFLTAIGAVATCLGNVGPGLGEVGPVDNFSHLPAAVKWILAFMMLTGRLELFTVLMLFNPGFWRKF
jgi:trk system potassium uptake protein TrkH